MAKDDDAVADAAVDSAAQAHQGTSALWDSGDCSAWAATLDSYWQTVESLNNPKLLELERWYQQELPRELRGAGALSKEQLVRLVDWKLTRGKWRPRLLDFAKASADDAVVDASRRALAALRGSQGTQCSAAVLKEALAPLIGIKGVGPSTATAVLAAADDSVAFMSDEALLAAVGTRKYTAPEALKLVAALRAKAAALSGAGRRQFTAGDVERALYAEAAAARAAAAGAKGAKKRKR